MAWGGNDLINKWNPQFDWRIGTRMLIVLDDVWSLSVLEQLIFRVAGCKTLVVSRFKFPTVLSTTYEVELLKGDEAVSLFCLSAFGQKSIPSTADSNLVKQVILNLLCFCFCVCPQPLKFSDAYR